MCGIFGILPKSRDCSDEAIELARRAENLMRMRGPDDGGLWHNDSIVFSFRRLSILDLSKAGHQPMVSLCGGYSIVFNGELYNFAEIKNQLEAKGYKFFSRTDTEVVLNALIEWGPNVIMKFNGMFALGFWDNKQQTLLIARDHVGMKPLYYSDNKGVFVFGSQLDQILLTLPKNELTIDKLGLALFLSLGYYPTPRTVFNEVKQLEPGQWLTVTRQGEVKRGEHFNLTSFYIVSKDNTINHNELKEAISDSVKRHLISDVPIGTFLSGGLDSGIITGLTQKVLGNDFIAYTLSNKGTVFDETERATQIANYLQIPHRIVHPVNVLGAVMKFQEAYQEPFGDYSAIPAMLVTAEAKKEVKVMLSGDGSDEFFFGYNRMTSMLKSGAYYKYPLLVRRLIKRLRPSLPSITYKNFNSMLLQRQCYGANKLFENIGVETDELVHEFYLPLNDNDQLSVDMKIKLNTIHRYFQLQLLKLDRASMYNSIEARVPFADKELMRYTIAYSARQATQKNFEIRKVPLQKIYLELYPQMQMQHGRKMGFTIDMEGMLNGELKEYYVDMLSCQSIFDNYIDFKSIRDDAQKGNQLSVFSRWFLLSLQTWYKRYY